MYYDRIYRIWYPLSHRNISGLDYITRLRDRTSTLYLSILHVYEGALISYSILCVDSSVPVIQSFICHPFNSQQNYTQAIQEKILKVNFSL